MKKFSTLLLCFLLAGFAEAQRDLAGTWAGKLTTPGGSLRLVVHFKYDGTKYSATLDSPDQGARGIPFGEVNITGDSLQLVLPAANAKYIGKRTSDSTISGQWMQGMSLPLDLKKMREGQTTDNVKRPQTPKPPFAYESRDVLYNNNDKSIQYGATITQPKGSGPFPAVLLISGSGPQNRDEELFGHKPFAVLADDLTKRGYLVLRVDDRGVGQTTGDFKSPTSKEFAADAMAGLDYLKTLPQVNKTKLGLLGHSEGGMIAEMIAAQRKDLDFIILLAAPGEKIIDLMADQNRAVLLSNGVNKETAEAYVSLYKPLALALTTIGDEVAAKKTARQLVASWRKQTASEMVQATTGIKDEQSETAFIDAFYKTVSQPWFRYFLQFDPAPFVEKFRAKVLALNGDKDIQVLAKPNLGGLKTALQKSPTKTYELKELNGLNHLFQHCQTCTVIEYGQLEETIAPEVLETIGEWLAKNVK
jgi:hypothetical protein